MSCFSTCSHILQRVSQDSEQVTFRCPVIRVGPQKEAVRGRPEISWLLPRSMGDASLHDLDHLTFFFQNPEFPSFCLIHQELVNGGALQGDQKQKRGAPR